MTTWQPIETAPRDGTTIEVRGVMLVHYVQGAKFPTMPGDWRPDTPQTRWQPTEWREVAMAAEHQEAASTNPRSDA